jgi:hypothetical protein
MTYARMSKRAVIAMILLATLCAAIPTSAQSHFGLRAGPTFGDMTGDFVEGSEGREVGVYLAVTVERQIGGNFALVTGVAFMQKGGMKLSLSSHDDRWGFRTTYLQIPLLLRHAFQIPNSRWSIAPYAGPALNLNTGCALKDADHFHFDLECEEGSPGGVPKSMEVSAPIGVAFWHEFEGGSRFVLETRLDLGFSNVFEEAGDLGMSARNNVLQAMFGFSLPLY